MGRIRAAARLGAAILLTGSALVLGGGTAAAAPQQDIGLAVTPAQPYKGNPDTSDWLGSYLVNGEQVFCVQFAFLAPDSDEQYQPGEALKTKWGTDLAPDVAADISYLLLRHAKPTTPDEGAAVAHLLHSWTAAPQDPSQLAPTNDFRHIAYDADFHLTRLPPTAKAMVQTLRNEAAAKHGPWTATLTAPSTPQLIGTAAPWTVTVHSAKGQGVDQVPVTVTVAQGTLPGGQTTGTVTTKADGTAAITVTPTGTDPKVTVSLASPADQPVVRQAIQLDIQRIVSTGGEKTLTTETATTAKTAPGTIKVAKVNETTNAGLAAVSLRLTAADKTAPALDQNGKQLTGADGKPAVLVTGPDGTVSVPNIQTPQQVCVIEVAPPAGFDKAFDPNSPPSACGTVNAGVTLTLTVPNKPNAPAVPIKIPAGDQPYPVAYGTVDRVAGPAAVLALAGLAVLVAGLGGLLVRRRITRGR